ncbi:cyclic GMP-AMP synthase-like receptor 1 [Mytilus edulis]|uniref:cyclic GMP-AMP synthase-like receptor 1 n=1 Tax=Mytilus edulis TaxID=6550 RepID=UPI0039EE3F4A
MAESEIKNASISLYDHLCQNIVGSEDHVKTLRIMNTVRDNLQSNKTFSFITSGSFGEGLEMRGSDLDIMVVRKQIEVFEDKHMYLNADKTHFTMELGDTQPGFTKLLLEHSNDPGIRKVCVEIGGDFYLSNLLVKKGVTKDRYSIVHGPCVSDEDGFYDFACCVHSKLWIPQAKQWITRSNNAWPTFDVKQAIVKHGVLFVPVGVKGSTQEELEWRISFSVGEKLLINSFTHTQLLCYALMKILLKDVIAVDADCKELLCSYFMKTILFWICEELPLSLWKPENLISCYMKYFRRLIYCVEYNVCAHYFIPENNLFENKIHGKAQETLLNKLYILKRGTKDTKGTVKLINLKQTDNALAKNEKDKQKNNSTHDTT